MELRLGILDNGMLPTVSRRGSTAAAVDHTTRRVPLLEQKQFAGRDISKRNQLPADAAINQRFTI
jgi:hypothetical protein